MPKNTTYPTNKKNKPGGKEGGTPVHGGLKASKETGVSGGVKSSSTTKYSGAV